MWQMPHETINAHDTHMTENIYIQKNNNNAAKIIQIHKIISNEKRHKPLIRVQKTRYQAITLRFNTENKRQTHPNDCITLSLSVDDIPSWHNFFFIILHFTQAASCFCNCLGFCGCHFRMKCKIFKMRHVLDEKQSHRMKCIHERWNKMWEKKKFKT